MDKGLLSHEPWLRKYDHLIGGFAGGVVSTAVCHPMDLLKIRYSADEGSSFRPRYRSYFHATKCIIRAEGLRGIYQGLTPNMVGAALSWGLYMEWYHKIKAVLPLHSPNENLDNFLIGFVAGAAVMCVTNPIWVTKTRLCLQYETGAAKKYSGMVDCLRKIYLEEGVRGLYRGFVPGLFGTVHGALQFMIYNRMKAWRCERNGLVKDSQLGQTDYLMFSAISKVIATTATFPYQVLRTRMQFIWQKEAYPGPLRLLYRYGLCDFCDLQMGANAPKQTCLTEDYERHIPELHTVTFRTTTWKQEEYGEQLWTPYRERVYEVCIKAA